MPSNDTPGRGQIRNRGYLQQVKSFAGIRFGTITPTDIDVFIEYRDKGFIFGETKYNHSPVPYGQRLALERLCGSLNRQALAIIASHQSDGDIDVGEARVISFMWNNDNRPGWRTPKAPVSVRQLMARFIQFLDSARDRERT